MYKLFTCIFEDTCSNDSLSISVLIPQNALHNLHYLTLKLTVVTNSLVIVNKLICRLEFILRSLWFFL